MKTVSSPLRPQINNDIEMDAHAVEATSGDGNMVRAVSEFSRDGVEEASKADATTSGSQDGAGVHEADFDEDEGRAAVAMPDPGQPSAEEKRLHDLTHIPYRGWCAKCVQGRGRDTYHGRIKEQSRVPRISMDFMFLTERGITIDRQEVDKADECITILVLKDDMHKSIWAYPMEAKTIIKSEWLISQIIDDMKTCGLDNCHIVAKNDNEAAILEIQEELARRRRSTNTDAQGTVIENSRVGDSSSNGSVERAIQETGNMIKTYKAAVMHNLKYDKLKLSHPQVP